MSKIKRLRAVLSGAVASALAVTMLPVLATTATAATDPLGGQPGPVTLSPTMGQDGWQPNPPAGTTVDDFMRHPVLSWTAISSLPVTQYRVQISPNANFTNNTVTLPNGGLTKSTQYDLPQTLPHASYYWRVRGEDGAGHATLWTGTQEGDYQSTWQFTKTWIDVPANPLPATGSSSLRAFSWQPLPDASAYEFVISQDPGFPKSLSGIETYDCTTNHTAFSPSTDYPLKPSPATSAVEGGCDDFTTLMKDLQNGGTWYWHVRGIDGTSAAPTAAETAVTCYSDGADCGPWTATSTLSLPSMPGSGVALTPTNLSSGCSAVVPGGTVPLCYDTPTLTWNPVPNANSYLVETSADPLFTTDYHSSLTAFSAFTPRQSFHDNQAGGSYYWRVRACDTNFSGSGTFCTGASLQTPQFHKASLPLPLTPAGATSTTGHNGLYVTTDNNQVPSSAVKQVRGAQMTFHWDDLLQYEQQAGIAANQEAKEYRLQYSTSGNWLDDTATTTVVTDATHWTKQDGALADGGYYWRVAPVDGSGNLLAWSPTQTVVKGTVAPTVTIGETGLLAPTSV
ncbi:MAG: large repetitive protein, partial [Frankiales bacterium]|nr:large repetitive protein [Frankiales bacterium]